MAHTNNSSSSSPHTRVCVGVIVGVHGIQGVVKVKSYTEVPEDLLAYPLTDVKGVRFLELQYERENKGLLYVRVKGIKDRTAAESLKGLELYTSSENFEEPDEEEYFYSDLVGKEAYTLESEFIGKVSAVHNFGAGDFLEILHPETGNLYTISFTKEAVPEVLEEKIVLDKEFLLSAQENSDLGEPK